jgi:hypothetical protein
MTIHGWIEQSVVRDVEFPVVERNAAPGWDSLIMTLCPIIRRRIDFPFCLIFERQEPFR